MLCMCAKGLHTYRGGDYKGGYFQATAPHFAVAIFFFTFITIQARILSMVYWLNNQHISWTYVISNEKHPFLLRGSKRERRKPLHFANINYQCCIITTPVRDTRVAILDTRGEHAAVLIMRITTLLVMTHLLLKLQHIDIEVINMIIRLDHEALLTRNLVT